MASLTELLTLIRVCCQWKYSAAITIRTATVISMRRRVFIRGNIGSGFGCNLDS